jgi:hypothetical protein
MGAKLEALYAEADRVGGMKAKVRMAMITKLTTKTAGSAPDSPENIKIFQDALAEVKKSLQT